MNHSDNIDFIQELVVNTDFKKWVLNPDQETESKWQNWLAQNPDYANDVELARSIVLNMADNQVSMPEKEKDSIRKYLEHHVHTSPQVNKSEYPGYRKIRSMAKKRMTGFRVAASLILLAVAGAVLWTEMFRFDGIERVTETGEKKEITLPDQSVVVLNSNSRIRYKDDFQKGDKREVWLNGEGFFDVKHLKKEKEVSFIVHTNDMDVKVLGTRFNVDNYTGNTEVALQSGKVQIATKSWLTESKSFVLNPGDFIGYDGEKVEKKKVNIEKIALWKQGKLLYDGKPIHLILKELEAEFGLQIVYNGHPEHVRSKLKGTFPADNLNILLTSIAKTTNTEVKRKDDKIVFQKSK